MERVNGEIATSRRLSDELVEVCIGQSVVGFVELAGAVYVALYGGRYDRAEEVAQSLSFDAAVAGLLSHARVVAILTGELGKPVVPPVAATAAKPAARSAQSAAPAHPKHAASASRVA